MTSNETPTDRNWRQNHMLNVRSWEDRQPVYKFN